jgi:DnaJ-like protein
MPRTFPDLGPDTLVPKLKPSALTVLKLSAEEGFVLSRIDGRSTVGEICLLVPFDPEVTATILTQLTRVGAIEIPGNRIPATIPTLPPEPSRVEPLPEREKRETPVAVAKGPNVEGLEITVDAARRIDAFFAALQQKDAFELLEIGRTTDKKEIKRAYFKLSKELHPDRYFGKNIGPYRERLSKIFQAIKVAYDVLIDDARRTAYLESVEK